MKKKIICGIQQIGIGVSNIKEAWKWYREYFGMDIRIFEDKSVANLMLPYTGGQPQKRHAVLAANLQGGAGFEIWQYTQRTPEGPKFEINIGDLGIFAVKIKSKDIKATYKSFKSKNLNVSEILKDPIGFEYFFVTDPYRNIFQIVNDLDYFKNEKKLTGAANGAIIGVTDIEKSKILYSDILEYDKVIYDKEQIFDDFSLFPGGYFKLRRVLLKHSRQRKGAFCQLYGPSIIELIKVSGRKPKRIYENRYWGDLGFIHLCFDIVGMNELHEECKEKGFPFKVDSSKSFNMGEAAGHFSYVEDPDGTLIEFVETHKVPIIKKIGWSLNLKKRNPEKALPNWIIKTLRFNRIKN